MKRQIYKGLTIQYVVGFFFIVGTTVWNIEIFFSGLVGCLAGLLPATYLSSRMARKIDEFTVHEWLSHVYKAQLGKWLMTIMIFVLILNAEYAWNFAILFAGFCFIHLTSCVVPLMIKGD
jgi:F0F1-type ATP synthase assembly protein I